MNDLIKKKPIIIIPLFVIAVIAISLLVNNLASKALDRQHQLRKEKKIIALKSERMSISNRLIEGKLNKNEALEEAIRVLEISYHLGEIGEEEAKKRAEKLVEEYEKSFVKTEESTNEFGLKDYETATNPITKTKENNHDKDD